MFQSNVHTELKWLLKCLFQSSSRIEGETDWNRGSRIGSAPGDEVPPFLAAAQVPSSALPALWTADRCARNRKEGSGVGEYRTGSGSVDHSIHELNWNIINLMRTYFDPNVLRQSWERWRWIIVCDVRNILVEKIFAIPASRGLCFLDVIVARLKNERIFSASVAWNKSRESRSKKNTHRRETSMPLIFRSKSRNG